MLGCFVFWIACGTSETTSKEEPKPTPESIIEPSIETTDGDDTGVDTASAATDCDGFTWDSLQHQPPTLRRLSQFEYQNSLHVLLGIEQQLVDYLIPNESGDGYDTIGASQSLTDVHLEGYMLAAQVALLEATSWYSQQWDAEDIQAIGTEPSFSNQQGVVLTENGYVGTKIPLPSPGRYRFRAEVEGEVSPEPVHFVFSRKDAFTNAWDSFARFEAAETQQTYEIELFMDGGGTTFFVGLPDDSPANAQVRVNWLQLEGPLAHDTYKNNVLICEPTASPNPEMCLRQIISHFGRMAWRRPLKPDEVDELAALSMQLLAEGDDVDVVLQVMLQSMLISPHFIFMPEIDHGQGKTLDDHELASRLSYFLWSQPPDEILRNFADAQQLSQDDILRQQVRRMLADTRASEFVDHFTGQWLSLRSLDYPVADPALFAGFSLDLAKQMRFESQQFVHSFLQENKPIHELLTADYSYLNTDLAIWYGLSDRPEDFTRVQLGGKRSGLLTHGGIMSVYAYADQSNPVGRGKWMSRAILCLEPPPPPPDVDELIVVPTEGLSKKQAMAAHLSDPSCLGCHKIMDPLGFSLEHFDATGRYREIDEWGNPVDPSGELFGMTFTDVVSMADLLQQSPRFSRCLTAHLLEYGVGRKVDYVDEECALREVVDTAGDSLPELIEAVVMSPLFRQRSPQEEE